MFSKVASISPPDERSPNLSVVNVPINVSAAIIPQVEFEEKPLNANEQSVLSLQNFAQQQLQNSGSL